MGGALYPTLDFKNGEICATIEIKMTYFKAARKGVLDCHTEVINKGKRVAMIESEIWNEDKLIAKATGSFAIFTPSKSMSKNRVCLLYTSPSPRDATLSRMPSSA